MSTKVHMFLRNPELPKIKNGEGLKAACGKPATYHSVNLVKEACSTCLHIAIAKLNESYAREEFLLTIPEFISTFLNGRADYYESMFND